MTLTVADYFCGAGGSSSGAEQVPGVRVVMAANHWDLAVRTHNANFQHADHDQADISGIDPHRHPYTDIGWWSPECFPAGTTVLTRRGPIPIEDVRTGDEVLTHRLRWRTVTATMNKIADTVIVSGYGHSRLETTAEHPFYTRDSKPSYATRKGVGAGPAYRVPREHFVAEWVSAGDLRKNHYWASPVEFGPPAQPPAVGRRGIAFDGDFWWFVGRWLGDGCLRASRGEVQVTCGHHEADDLGKRLAALVPPTSERAGEGELRWSRRDIRTATVFTTSHIGLMEWLRCHFGQHADAKRLPAWALAMRRDWRECLLDGYASADGHLSTTPGQRPKQICNSISRSLAVSIRLLALSLGWKASMSVSSKRTEGMIEGRRVNMRPLWQVQWCIDPSPDHDQTLLADGIRWSPVRGSKPGRAGVRVYNLSVEEDESYLADGLIVHNCTNWSVAKGVKQMYDGRPTQLDLFGDDEPPLPDEAAQRSRMLMQDVPRFAEVRRYRALIVENVTDILKWEHLDVWLGRMANLGYRHRVVVLNSAFAAALGPGAPQLRDRVYFVFWQARYREPDFAKWTRPRAWCPVCGEDVNAIQVIKPGKRRALRYGQQYDYRCPRTTCRMAVVRPYALPAASAIDWSIEGQRIGDRATPLRPKTVARIKAGLRRYSRPALVPAGGTWNDDARPVDEPMRARTTSENEGLACPPFLAPMRSGRPRTILAAAEPMATVAADGSNHALLVPVEGRDGKMAQPVGAPMRAQTARAETAIVVPLRNNGVARPVSDPLLAFAAGGGHQAIVTRHFSTEPGADAGYLSTPVDEPLRTLVASGEHHSLIRWGDAIFPYDGTTFRPVRLPLPTQTSIQGDALLGPAVAVDDCTFRMLEIAEIHRGMAFLDNYRLPYGSKRERVRLLGNAVTPPAARDLVAAVVEAITGDAIDLVVAA